MCKRLGRRSVLLGVGVLVTPGVLALCEVKGTMAASVGRGMSQVSAGPLGVRRPQVLVVGRVCVRPPQLGSFVGLWWAVPGEGHRFGKEHEELKGGRVDFFSVG